MKLEAEVRTKQEQIERQTSQITGLLAEIGEMAGLKQLKTEWDAVLVLCSDVKGLTSPTQLGQTLADMQQKLLLLTFECKEKVAATNDERDQARSELATTAQKLAAAQQTMSVCMSPVKEWLQEADPEDEKGAAGKKRALEKMERESELHGWMQVLLNWMKELQEKVNYFRQEARSGKEIKAFQDQLPVHDPHSGAKAEVAKLQAEVTRLNAELEAQRTQLAPGQAQQGREGNTSAPDSKGASNAGAPATDQTTCATLHEENEDAEKV